MLTNRCGDVDHMDVSLRRLVGSLALLLGITFLAVGIYTGQVSGVMEIVGRVLEAAVAGAP